MDSLRPGLLMEGKYRLSEELSRNGRVVVFRAENLDIARDVHIKTLTREIEGDDASRRDLMREAKAAGSVAHENVQSVLDSGTDARGLPFIVFEALEGINLAEWMRSEGTLRTEEEVTSLMIPLLEGLSAVHEGGVIHRAITPETIILKPLRRGERLLKLTDFSHAVLVDAEDERWRGAPDSELPTAVRLPPERASRGRPTPSWDVYATGLLMRDLLTDPNSGSFFGTPLMERVIRGSTAAQEEERYPTGRIMLEAATVLTHAGRNLSTIPAPDAEGDNPGNDGLGEDLRFLKLRRDTNHDRHSEAEGDGRVRLVLVLLVIEWLFKTLGDQRWREIVERVPAVEELLPGGGNTEVHRKLGIEVSILSELLGAADALVGQGDLAYVAVLGERISDRAVSRLLPERPVALSPAQVPALFPRLWRAMTRQGRATVLDRGDGWAVLSVERQVQPSLEVTALVAGVLRGLLRFSNSTACKVQITASQALGDRATVFRLSW